MVTRALTAITLRPGALPLCSSTGASRSAIPLCRSGRLLPLVLLFLAYVLYFQSQTRIKGSLLKVGGRFEKQRQRLKAVLCARHFLTDPLQPYHSTPEGLHDSKHKHSSCVLLSWVGMETEVEEGWVRGAIIGVGAHGTVSLTKNSSNGHIFAVKSTAGYSWALDNEYKILRCMNSPYVVRCLEHNYSVVNGVRTHNLFMEYIPGGSVGDLLVKFGGQLNESVIRAYTRGILRGIDYLHRQGIVHCDIKGKNVLVGDNGLKLADFGSAKRLVDKEEGQETLQLRGTPLWMAPEAVNQVERGPASDIWSLGCTVLEMATGRPPWSNVSNPLTAMYKIGCTQELPKLPASLSPQIQDFQEKCFRRDPKKRWTSTELLNHPFLKEDCSTMKEEAIRVPVSPTSNLDFGDQAWNSYPSTPIPSLGIPSPTGETNAEVNRSIELCPRPSPRQRVMGLATGCKYGDVADWSNWSAIPHGQWVVVSLDHLQRQLSNFR